MPATKPDLSLDTLWPSGKRTIRFVTKNFDVEAPPNQADTPRACRHAAYRLSDLVWAA